MTPHWIPRALIAATTLAIAAVVAPAADAETIVGLSGGNQLIKFDSATPGTLIGSPVNISGLNGGDSLLSIDRNPFDGFLYGIGTANYVYRITDAGTATQVGPQLALSGTHPQIEWDPRNGSALISTATRKQYLWGTSGALFPKTDFAYAGGDPNAAKNAPNITGVAFSNNVANADTTTAYGYDYANDAVITIGSPGGTPDSPFDGVLHTLGASGVVSFGSFSGFDVAQDGTLYTLIKANADSKTRLYTTNKSTGALSSIGLVGNGTGAITDIATDIPTNVYSLGAAIYPVSESAGTVTVTVNRSQSHGEGTVDVVPTDGTAKAKLDYKQQTQSISFKDGETTKNAKFEIRSDALDGGDRTFTVALANPALGHASTAAPDTAIVQMQDDDSGPPPSEKLTLLTDANSLVTLDSASPGDVSAPLPITGLKQGENVLAIDRRPATGQLYALGSSRLYTLDESTGAATPVATLSPPPASAAVGFDFDPVTDRVRFTTGAQNITLDPDTGIDVPDDMFVYDVGQPLSGKPTLTSLAYDNNVPGATSSTLFGYDIFADQAVRLMSRSTGTLAALGPSGIITTGTVNNDLDITPAGNAWFVAVDNTLARLNLLDLDTGNLASAGLIGDGSGFYRDVAGPAVANTIQVDGDSVSVPENGGGATVKVVRSQSRGVATVDFATANDSAAAGSDYADTHGTVSFADGETAKTISIPVTDDASAEGSETFRLALSNPRGGAASLGSPAGATVTIADNDKAGGPQPDPKAKVTLCGKTKQDIVKQKYVSVCLTSNEAASADLTGKFVVKGVKKPFTLPTLKGQKLTAGKALTVRVKLSKKIVAAAKKGKKATATIVIAVRDSGGNVTSATRKVTLSLSRKT